MFKSKMLFISILILGITDVTAIMVPSPVDIPCSNQMCLGQKDGNYEYENQNQNEPSNPAYFLSCVNGRAYCRFCWPITLEYSANCNQCLLKKDAPCWAPYVDPGKVEKGWTAWTDSTACSTNCGYGIQTRTRKCRKTNGNCPGEGIKINNCLRKICKGKQGVLDMQRLVIDIVQKFFEESLSYVDITAKIQRAMFQIYKAALEMINLGQTNNDGLSTFARAEFLKDVIKKAVASDQIPFARMSLGKIIVVLIKMELQNKTPLQDILELANIELKQIKRQSGTKFDQIFSSNGEATLMFAIDTTGSMKNEIKAAKKIAAGIVNSVKGHPIDCILSPFNDPHTGPVTKTSPDDIHQCVSAIHKLEAELGGDCPELAYTGMLDAIKSRPKFGSPLFVFTDAAARDGTAQNIGELKNLAEANSVTINFLLTKSTCLLKDDEYTEIAKSTNGQVFPLEESELGNLVTYVRSSLFLDTSISTGDTAAATKFFDVDSGIALLIVTVTVKNKNTARMVDLIDPFGDTPPANVTLSNLRIFEIVRPTPGRWELAFPQVVVGNLSFQIGAISEEPIEFDIDFLAEIDDKVFTVFNPIADEDNTINVKVGGWKLVKKQTLKIDIIDEIGIKLISDISIKEEKSSHENKEESSHLFTGKFVPPAFPFKVILKGQKKDGTNFQRVSRKVVFVQYSFLQVATAGNDSTIKIGAKNAPIKIQVLNTGLAREYTFKISCHFGQVAPQAVTSKIDKIGFVDFHYTAPTDSKFTADTISVIAESLATPTSHYTFQVLLVS